MKKKAEEAETGGLRFGETDSEALGGELTDRGAANIWLQTVEPYLRASLRINPDDIQEEFVRVPGDLAYWNSRYADAQRAQLTAELDEKVLKAELEAPVRLALISAGAKVTESMVKAGVESHDDYVQAQRHTIDCEVEKSKCFGYLDAIRSKRDMIISLGAHIRAEMQGDPLVREAMRGAHGRTG